MDRVCINDASYTDIYGSFACRSGEPTVPACAGHCISDGGRRTFSSRVYADEHSSLSKCFGLPGCRWDLVLAWPQVGFTSRANPMPPYPRPSNMLPGCT